MAKRDREARKVKEAIDLFDKMLTMVKNEHEMYFLGISKKPPASKVRDLKRALRDLEDMQVLNTAMTFQVRRMRNKFNTYNTLWMRTIKQIEEGTYRRQRFLANHREADRKKQHESSEKVRDQIRALARGGDVEDATATIQNGSMKAPEPTLRSGEHHRPKARPQAKREQSGHAIGSRELLREYLTARKAVGKAGAVDPRALDKALQKQAAQIKARYGVKDVKFRVVAENGKAKVKAIPIK
jgi:hypothetical protein